MNRTQLLVVSAVVLCAAAFSARRESSPPGVVAPAAPLPVVKPAQAGPVMFSAALSSSRVLAGPSQVYAKLDLSAGAGRGERQRVPVNLALAIDHSGSMAGGKMQQAKRAATELLEQLQPGDRLAIVAFDDQVTLFPSTPITEDSKRALRAFISEIHEAGSTNISGALSAATAQLRSHASDFRVSRVMLLSDGQPTAGITNPQSLVKATDAMRAERISTSTFGVGLDFNGGLMRDLASHGGGGFAFVEDAATLGPQFARELTDASQLLARDVRVRFEVPEGVYVDDVPGHDFTRTSNGAELSLYDFGPAQTAQVLVRLQVNAPKAGTISLGTASLQLVDVAADREVLTAWPLGAMVTTDPGEVEAASDLQVTEMAKRVDIAGRVAKAQAAYERGDTKLAFDLMGETRRLFGSSADALAGSEDVVEGNWRRGGSDAQRANLQLTQKQMKNFGQNNAY